MSTNGELAGKVALVTGGARGQGAAEAALFLREGATVVATDVLDEQGEQTAGSLGCEYLHLDVTSEEEWEAVVADVIARHGRLDILMNNAGIFRPAQLINTSTEMWDQMVAINQTGVFLGMRTAVRVMIEGGQGGSIINTSSVAGLEGVFGSTAYGATKWAVTGMTKTVAKEVGKHGIRVNSIHPGVIATDMVTDML
ncbi:MAG: SDR family NAD(P)-dependent oxidoreductase, partial [Actinomycetota bacterium]